MATAMAMAMVVVMMMMVEKIEGEDIYPTKILSGQLNMTWQTTNKYMDSGVIVLSSPSRSFFLSMTSCRIAVVHNDSGAILDATVWDARLPGCSLADTQTLTLGLDGNLVGWSGDPSSGRASQSWSSGTAGLQVASMELRDDGNLILADSNSTLVWQSFDHPSYVLISGQKLRVGRNLSISYDYLSRISYGLVVEPWRAVLYANGKPYWQLLPDAAASSVAEVSYAALSGGILRLYDANGKVLTGEGVGHTEQGGLWLLELGAWASEPSGIQHGGNLRIYQWSDMVWTLQWQAINNSCQLPDACNPYETCDPDSQHCSCELPLKPAIATGCDLPRINEQGLQPNFCSNDDGNGPTQQAPHRIAFVKMNGHSYFPLLNSGEMPQQSTFHNCRSHCAQNCSCAAFVYNNVARTCYPIHEEKELRTMSLTLVNDIHSVVYLRTSSAISLAMANLLLSNVLGCLVVALLRFN